MDEMDATLLAETENFMVWTSETDGEKLIHLELGSATLHLLSEEWDELLTLVKMLSD